MFSLIMTPDIFLLVMAVITITGLFVLSMAAYLEG